MRRGFIGGLLRLAFSRVCELGLGQSSHDFLLFFHEVLVVGNNEVHLVIEGTGSRFDWVAGLLVWVSDRQILVGVPGLST